MKDRKPLPTWVPTPSVEPADYSGLLAEKAEVRKKVTWQDSCCHKDFTLKLVEHEHSGSWGKPTHQSWRHVKI